METVEWIIGDDIISLPVDQLEMMVEWLSSISC